MHPIRQNHRRVVLASIVSVALWLGNSELQAQTYLLDFGANATNTTNGPSPDDPLNFWNNVLESTGISNTGQLLNLVTTSNTPSDIDLFMISRFNASNTNGTTASTIYPMDATRDSLFGNTEVFNGITNIFPSFKFAALDPAKTYNLTFYASRTGVAVGENRETVYTVSGGISGSVALNVANNVDNRVTLFGMTPSAFGEITISLAPGAANNNANHFTYVGVLELTAIPEPSTAGLLLGSAAVLSVRRRRSTAPQA